MRNVFSNGIGTQFKSAPLVTDHVQASGGIGKRVSGRNMESWTRFVGSARVALLHQMIGPIDDIVPRAAMPVVVAGEVKHASSFHIERHIVVLGELVEKMARVRAFIAAAPVVGAAHVGARTDDPLIRPALPLPIRIQPDGNDRWFGSEQRRGNERRARAGG